MALGVASIVSVHLVCATIQERMQSGYQLGNQGYTHVLHSSQLTTDQYELAPGMAARTGWQRAGCGGGQSDIENGAGGR